MFGSFGIVELVLILVIVLIVFGAGRLPQLGEGLGKAIKGFKKSAHEPDTIDVTADQVAQPEEPAAPASEQASGAGPAQGTVPKSSHHKGSS